MQATRSHGREQRTPAHAIAAAIACAISCACASAPKPPSGPVEPGHGLVFQSASIETGDGRLALALEHENGSVRLLDARRRQLARYTVDSARISVRDARDREIASLLRGPGGFAWHPRSATIPSLRLTLEPDGDLRLNRGSTRLFDLKSRNYGYKIVNAEQRTLGRVREGSERIAVKNEARETVRLTRAPLSAASVALLMLPELELAESGGFAVALAAWGLPE